MIGYSLTLPLGPSINSYYKRTMINGKRGQRISDEGQAFRVEVRNAVVRSQMPKLTGRLCVVMRVSPRDKRMQDIDNRIKACLDSLQHAGAFVNDEQVDDLQVTRGPIVSGGRIEIMIGELPCRP